MRKISRRKFVTRMIFAIFAIFISKTLFFVKDTARIIRGINPKFFPGKIKTNGNFNSVGEKLAG